MNLFTFLKIISKFGVIVSLLIMAIFGAYSFSALGDFYTYKKTSDPKLELTLDRFHFFLRNTLEKEWLKITAPRPLDDNSSSLKTFHISVDQADIDGLNVDLPESGKDHYVKGYMRVSDDKEIKKILLRYRGDQINHYLFDKKSLRIKLLSGSLYDMHKKFNLINPPMITTVIDAINYNKARKIGLLSPDFYPARVFLNSKYMGVYFFLSQIDESLVRVSKKMPGSIYRGDYGNYNVPDKKGVSTLWKDERAWQKVAARNAEQKNNRDDIRYFISKVNTEDDLDFFKFFNKYLDKNNFYAYFALDVIFGSNHHDFSHNHYIYFDPYKGKYEPVEWDLRYWGGSNVKDVSIYPLLNRVRLNPVLEAERDKVAYDLLNSDEFSILNLSKELDRLNDNLFSDLQSDIYKDKAGDGEHVKIIKNMWFSTGFNMTEYGKASDNLKEVLKIRRGKLSDIYNNAVVVYSEIKNKSHSVYAFSITGNSPVELVFNKSDMVYRDVNFNGALDDVDIEVKISDVLYPGRKWIKGTINNWPKFQYGDKHLINSSLNYQYIIIGDNPSISNYDFKNYITSKEVVPKKGVIKKGANTDSIHPWSLSKPKYSNKVLSGLINVKKNTIFDKYTSVIIKPGTVFSLDEGVSIYFYGKVTAIGTKHEPIKFISKNKNKPWGLVAIQGEAASGSKFKYVEFDGGSLDTHNLIQYTSPFNIHDVNWFEVDHCKIGKNYIGDDAMHVAYSKGVISNCEFIDARSDALDIDISEVIVKSNVFYNSGNDALDIMTTKMEASNNLFINAGDKGISVGEWSDANISNSVFINNGIGVEIKDKSSVIANNLVIANSRLKAINLYNKNMRYNEGGRFVGVDVTFVGNDSVTADKKSSFKFNDHTIKNLLILDQIRKMPIDLDKYKTNYGGIVNELEAAVIK